VLHSATDRSAGHTIGAGRYVLHARLGGGRASDVYRALDRLLQRPVAVKIFRACADPSEEPRFRDEARLLGTLFHPGVVTIYDTGVDEGRPYQVLQLVDGQTLRDRLVDGPLTPQQVMHIGAQLATALAHVHRKGIVHRDMKPANVLDDGRRVYLADFGISRLLDGAHHTATGMTLGTAAYMAPEQVLGNPVGQPADVYALGLVLLECLTGHREYSGTAVEAAMARLTRPPLIPSYVPAPLRELITAMTNNDPHARPSAYECAIALRGGGTRTLPTVPVERHVHKRRVRIVLAVLALMVVLLASAVALVTHRPPTPASSPSGTPTGSASISPRLAPPPPANGAEGLRAVPGRQSPAVGSPWVEPSPSAAPSRSPRRDAATGKDAATGQDPAPGKGAGQGRQTKANPPKPKN
jgi:hypothetical protein